jgi:hypothetical protein
MVRDWIFSYNNVYIFNFLKTLLIERFKWGVINVWRREKFRVID